MFFLDVIIGISYLSGDECILADASDVLANFNFQYFHVTRFIYGKQNVFRNALPKRKRRFAIVLFNLLDICLRNFSTLRHANRAEKTKPISEYGNIFMQDRE